MGCEFSTWRLNIHCWLIWVWCPDFFCMSWQFLPNTAGLYFYLRVSTFALINVLISIKTNCLVGGSWLDAGFLGFALLTCTGEPLLPFFYRPQRWPAMTTRKPTAETIGLHLNPSLHWWPQAHARESCTRCPIENNCKAINVHLRTHLYTMICLFSYII